MAIEEFMSGLQEILVSLQKNIPNIQAAAIISQEGLPIASILPENVDDIKIAAMTAAMLSLGERAAMELQRGEMEELIISGSEGYVITMAAGKNAVLTVSIPSTVKLGLIFHFMRPAAQEIEKRIV
ncbi:MAG: roadblock/LC7 domain-containing protein [Candidatus Asgardarchaeia archaeon]